jgi:gallate decarboxylase subunit D
LVAVWGGEKPHIGAVAVAQSRPSLRNPEARSATASVICFPAHKEDEMAKAISQVLAAALDTKVVVTAGMHWDNLGEEGIRKVIQNGETLVNLILEALLVPPPRHEDSKKNF